jgi:nitrogen-specific signal transduction histidine kinase
MVRNGRVRSTILMTSPARAHLDSGAAFLSTSPPHWGQTRAAYAFVAVIVAAFVIAAPFSHHPAGPHPGFVAAYDAGLFIIDLVIALLLISQFARVGSAALLVLGAGYLFESFMVVARALSFPGLFAPGGVLGSDEQTSVWIYVFWHGGFAVFLIAYALVRMRERRPQAAAGTVATTAAVVSAIAGLSVALAYVAFSNSPMLPAVIRGNDYSLLITTGVGTAVWALGFASFALLFPIRGRSVLDLWLWVVAVACTLEVAMALMIGSTRFDLSFYVSRAYGLLASTVVLAALLVEMNRLYGGVAEALATARARTEQLEKLLLERAPLAATVENSSDFIGICDLDLIPFYINPAGQRLVGLDGIGEVRRTKVMDYFMPDELPRIRTEVFPAVEAGGRWSGEVLFRHFKTGEPISVLYDVFRVNDPTTAMPAFFATVTRDLTRQKQIEQILMDSRKMESIGQLTGGLAHDFNNLLMAVLVNLKLLQKTVDDPRRQRLIENALGGANRGAELVQQLLAFARQQTLAPTPTDINELIGGMTGLLEVTLGSTVRVETALAPDLWPAMADKTQVETIVLNLGINARDAMAADGVIEIRTANVITAPDGRPEAPPAGEFVAVTVADTGPGILPELMSRIFEPFFTTKPVGKGSGLGLSQVLGVAKQLGGGVDIVSAPNRGAEVTVYLPRALAAFEPTPDHTYEEPSAEPAHEWRVLLVDDDTAVRDVIAESLRELGCQVSEAGNGSLALELLQRGAETFDILVVDYAMPGMNGGETAQRARALQPDLPIVFISGHATEAMADLAMGRTTVMRKPFEPARILVCIDDILKGR